jgi:hypothetical protein
VGGARGGQRREGPGDWAHAIASSFTVIGPSALTSAVWMARNFSGQSAVSISGIAGFSFACSVAGIAGRLQE